MYTNNFNTLSNYGNLSDPYSFSQYMPQPEFNYLTAFDTGNFNLDNVGGTTNWADNLSKWAPTGIDIFKNLAGLYMGMQQYGLMKDQLNLAKQTAERNYQAQKNTVNASFEDRQRARNAANPGAYQDTASYMAQYGIK